jgi:hypothetical protein
LPRPPKRSPETSPPRANAPRGAIGRIQLWDAGEDGNINTDDNTLFAAPGLFVP